MPICYVTRVWRPSSQECLETPRMAVRIHVQNARQDYSELTAMGHIHIWTRPHNNQISKTYFSFFRRNTMDRISAFGIVDQSKVFARLFDRNDVYNGKKIFF